MKRHNNEKRSHKRDNRFIRNVQLVSGCFGRVCAYDATLLGVVWCNKWSVIASDSSHYKTLNHILWGMGSNTQLGSSVALPANSSWPLMTKSIVQKRDCVLVAMNYRLGIFGYLALRELADARLGGWVDNFKFELSSEGQLDRKKLYDRSLAEGLRWTIIMRSKSGTQGGWPTRKQRKSGHHWSATRTALGAAEHFGVRRLGLPRT